jgi:putative intracellular protease/amidase
MKKLISVALLALAPLFISTPVLTQQPMKGKVLVIVSSVNAITLQNNKTYKTGYFLNELIVPVQRLKEQGYAVTFANPQGNRPSMDIHSDSADFFNKDNAKYQKAKIFHDNLVELQSPQKLTRVIQNGLDQYDAVFFPGGHAPMQDLINDPAVGKVLQHFHQAKKPTALICHAPIALIAAMPQSNKFVQSMRQGNLPQALAASKNWPYQGYKMTIFSTAEEKVAESKQLPGKMLFYPQAALQNAGGDVKIAKPWSSQVIQDRELITGQNPFSDDALAKTLVQAIVQRKNLLNKGK